ncbi:MAG: tRNA 4-thiouridine(8) synthase ThiI, partial [Candidatus Thorarchaeota archaeon]
IKMYIVPHGDDLTEVLRHAPRKMTCIFCRRNMYRLAQEVAFIENADAIVTGEIIGEQASQTTRNLLAEETAITEIPIMRPCVGDDKDEILKMAMKIRTYEFAHEAVSCCSLPPKYPTVYSNLEIIEPTEKKMDMGWIAAEISDSEVIILKDGS